MTGRAMQESDRARWDEADTKERRRLFRIREHCDHCGALVLPTERPGSVWLDYHCACGNAWLVLNQSTQRRISRALS